jgi:hypothetical protein
MGHESRLQLLLVVWGIAQGLFVLELFEDLLLWRFLLA